LKGPLPDRSLPQVHRGQKASAVAGGRSATTIQTHNGHADSW
jgi:hypothetical protein